MKTEPTMGDYADALKKDPKIDPPFGDIDVVDDFPIDRHEDPQLGDVDDVFEE